MIRLALAVLSILVAAPAFAADLDLTVGESAAISAGVRADIALSDGVLLSTWMAEGRVVIQRFDADLVPFGDPMIVSSGTIAANAAPRALARPGGFRVLWRTADGLVVREIGTDGTLGGEIVIPLTNGMADRDTAWCATSGGEALDVVWMHPDGETADGLFRWRSFLTTLRGGEETRRLVLEGRTYEWGLFGSCNAVRNPDGEVFAVIYSGYENRGFRVAADTVTKPGASQDRTSVLWTGRFTEVAAWDDVKVRLLGRPEEPATAFQILTDLDLRFSASAAKDDGVLAGGDAHSMGTYVPTLSAFVVDSTITRMKPGTSMRLPFVPARVVIEGDRGYVLSADRMRALPLRFEGDGVDDRHDNCPLTANPDQADSDGDGVGDVCGDLDADGVGEPFDNCPLSANGDQADGDGDGVGDVCDPMFDSDFDHLEDFEDNCPLIANADQSDVNGNGVGDVCDTVAPDPDGDGLFIDNCMFHPNPGQDDQDGDGVGNVCDDDVDGDAMPNYADNCPFTSNTDQANRDGDEWGDACDPAVPAPHLDGGFGGCSVTSRTHSRGGLAMLTVLAGAILAWRRRIR